MASAVCLRCVPSPTHSTVCLPTQAGLQWRMSALTRPTKITFGEMRDSGARGLLVYCQNYQCCRSTAISGDRWPDGIRLSDIEPPFTCQGCGKKGAEMSGPCLRIRAIECATTQQLPVTVARHPFSAR
jgi:hypothetical protein